MDAAASVPASTRRFAAKREALVAAASRLFNERGVRGVTLTDVAQCVGLAKNSVTYYFPRKEDLAAACFLRSIEVFTGIIERVHALSTPGERIRELIALHLRLHARIRSGEHPPVMAFRDIRALAPAVAGEVFEAYTAMFRRMRALLKGAATQSLGSDELNARAHLLVSFVNRLPQLVPRHDGGDSQGLVLRLGDMVLHGLRGAAASWLESGPEQHWQLDTGAQPATDSFLHAATVLINEQGYRGASVVRIAQRLQLTKGAFYHHHATKDDLVEQCFERSLRITRAALALARQTPGDGWLRVCCAVRGLVRYQVSPAGPLLRSTASAALPDPKRRARVTHAFAPVHDQLSGLVATGVADGSIRQTDALLCARYVLDSIDAAAELRRWVRAASEANVAALYVYPMLNGLVGES